MRLTLVISSLSAGGAERVMAIMANYWAGMGWKIDLLTFDDGSVPPFYKLDPRIRHRALSIAGCSDNPIGSFRNNIRRIAVLRAAIRESKPDCVISFIDQTNVLTLLATRTLGIPVIVEEHIHVQSSQLHRSWKLMRRLTYPHANLVIAITERALSSLPSGLRKRAIVIPNPALPPSRADGQPAREARTSRSIVSIGRLVPQKGFDLLLRAFALQKDIHPKWKLTILGEGPLRSELESLCEDLGLTGRVSMPGLVTNTEDYLDAADLFVLASHFEGFPMALCEAMASGLPVISTDCPSGPREIINDGEDGLLVPNGNLEALAAAMDRLISNEAERKRLAVGALRITERFGLPKIMALWEESLAEVVKGKR
jgi:glycosyltransferase involved in cell wall biosynthesis